MAHVAHVVASAARASGVLERDAGEIVEATGHWADSIGGFALKYQVMPPLSADEYEELKADIQARGVLVPVEYDEDGEILDGHHRVQICEELGITEWPRVVRIGLSEAGKLTHARQLNLARRHLDREQKRTLIAQQLRETPQTSDRQIAESLGVSPTTVGTVRSELEDAGELSKLDSCVGADGKTRPREVERPSAYRYVDPSAAGQKAIVESSREITDAKKQERRERQQQRHEEAVRAAADRQEPQAALTNDQAVVACDALITDPPYGILDEPWEPEKLEAFTREWADRWNECGAKCALIFWSQRYLFDGREWFDESLRDYEFQQLLVWHYPNNKSPQSRRGFKQTWEPVYFYRRLGSDFNVRVAGDAWGDGLNDFDCHVAAVPQSNFNDAERKVHPAQKPVSVFRWLINAVTQPGELVCDPFAGSGTSGVAAAQLGRRYHGVEIDAEFLKLARERVAAYGSSGLRAA